MTTHHDEIKDLHKMLEITRAMVAAQDVNHLLNLVVERGIELLDVERGTLFLYDGETNELVSRLATGVKELRVPASRGIGGETVRTGRTINVADAYSDSRFNPEPDKFTGFTTRNILSVPLRGFDGNLVGVLQLLNKRSGPFEQYDMDLAETLGAQAGVALQRAALMEHYIQKQYLERSLKIAQDIQRDLLPKTDPLVAGFDVSGFSQPADETGGDMYDFLELPDGRWMIIVADASGHGIGPAIVIAETRAMLRAVSRQGSDCSSVLRNVNDLLLSDLGESRFVTCFFGLLDASQSKLTFASAGHGPIIFYSAGNDSFARLPATSLPLGIMPGLDYADVGEFTFESGDFAVLVTDGFFEAQDPTGAELGLDRMLDFLRRDRDLPAVRMINSLHREVLHFTAGLPQADDLTAVVIRRR